MIRGGIVLAIARAEGRLTRRLVRYWVFVVVAWLVGVASYLYYGLLHRWSSAYGATMALLSPRYLIPIYGQLYLLIFMVGIIFLSFDVRARDVRERVAEVLDSRPYSNVELVLGRGLGILLLSWIPVVLITAFWAVLGLLIGESIEPVSLLDFLVFMSIPAFVFTVGLSFLASIALRFRLLSAVLVIAFLATMVFGGQFLPIRLSSLANVHGSFAIGYASDFVHFGAGIWGFAQRLAFVAAGISLALLAAALHPRLDDGSRGRRFAMGAAVAVVSALLFVGELHNVGSYLDDVLRWRDVHAGHEHDPAPDLLAMTAEVNIDPGRKLGLDADLRLAAPEGSPLEHALFSLNPGIVVASVTNAGGEELPFRFEDGLLDIDLPRPLAPGEETSVRLRAEGRPAENFAYLDAVRHPLSESGRDGALFLLGFQPMLFSRGSVALMPGCRWLPATGAEVGRGDPRVRPVDFFTLDLTVELPEGWLAAGPGRRQDGPEAPAGRVRYRFSPPAPVPEAALIAGRYESRSMDVEGVHFEALLHPSHVSNADFFEDAVPEIRTWLGDKLREARDLGLPYPYDALTLVEVPFPLRGYGGGWRMDTTFGPPAMVLVREASFPTARFDVHLSDASDFRDHEGGLPRAKREWLERFFENDFTGGNVFTAAARNFFTYQTSGTGNDGVPLDYVCDDLVTRLLTGKPGYFSAHIFNRDLNTIIGAIMTRWAVAGGSQSGLSGTELVIDAVTSRVEVWDQALGTSLSGLVPRDDPRRALDVLTLKGGAMARSLLDGLGSERVGHILGRLREQREGENFDRDDLIAAGGHEGADLGPLLHLWLDETDLPGFVLEKTDAYRLEDEGGSPRYQTLLTIRNDEPAGGMLRVGYRVEEPSGSNHARAKPEQSDPVRVPGHGAVEIGLVTARPPESVTVEPYLSLNRESFQADVPSIDEHKIAHAEPVRGAHEVAWSAPGGEAVVVDDLDPGFSVVESEGRGLWRLGARAAGEEETDGGLPVADPASAFRPPSRWSRRTSGSAWGKYRHTVAVVKSGRGERKAIFEAELPRDGRWELQLHLPSTRGRRRGGDSKLRGTWNLAVQDGSADQSVAFDLAGGAEGWNSLGTFEIAKGAVRVELSDETDAPFVLADAIRWVPAAGAAPQAQEVASR